MIALQSRRSTGRVDTFNVASKADLRIRSTLDKNCCSQMKASECTVCTRQPAKSLVLTFNQLHKLSAGNMVLATLSPEHFEDGLKLINERRFTQADLRRFGPCCLVEACVLVVWLSGLECFDLCHHSAPDAKQANQLVIWGQPQFSQPLPSQHTSWAMLKWC